MKARIIIDAMTSPAATPTPAAMAIVCELWHGVQALEKYVATTPELVDVANGTAKLESAVIVATADVENSSAVVVIVVKRVAMMTS